MTVDIEKMRADMRGEARKFILQAIVAAIAAIGVGVGIGNLIWGHQPPQPQPQSFIHPVAAGDDDPGAAVFVAAVGRPQWSK